MSPLERLTVVMTLMRRLQHVMDQEVAFLRQMKLDQLPDLQDEKATLSEAYELEMNFLRRNPEILGSLDEGYRETLQEEVREFQRSVAENAIALKAASEVIERLMARLADSVSTAQSSASGYGMTSANRGQVISVAFDRQL